MDVGVAIGLSLVELANPGRSGKSGRERPHVVLAGTMQCHGCRPMSCANQSFAIRDGACTSAHSQPGVSLGLITGTYPWLRPGIPEELP